jgi:putative FmdB family regulatory protein
LGLLRLRGRFLAPEEAPDVPLYEYQCPKCGRFELIRKFSDEPVTACPTCGSEVQKLASAPAFHLKGTGWYVTDYAKKPSGEGGKPADAKSGEGKGDTGTSGESKSGESKSDTKSSKEPSTTTPATTTTTKKD